MILSIRKFITPRGVIAALTTLLWPVRYALSENDLQVTFRARTYNSGFPFADESFNGLSSASDGKIYYVLPSKSIDQGAQMFVFDPVSERIGRVGDLTEASGEKGLKAIPQGKSHVNFVESDGKLFFATHTNYYRYVVDRETMAPPPPGYRPYPGGHFLSYDLARNRFEDLAKVPEGEGILAMNMDTQRKRIYAVTWPSGLFFRYDILSRSLRNLGPVSALGEKGQGPTWRVLCRSIAVNPEDGSAYLTTATGQILRYSYKADTLTLVPGLSLHRKEFGEWNPDKPGHMGYNWRQTAWHDRQHVFYAVHGNSGYLIRFNPRKPSLEILDRIVSAERKRLGGFDKFFYGYLGFKLGPDGRTLYYLTGAPSSSPSTNSDEALHLVTWDTEANRYSDHGSVLLEDGSRPSSVQSIAIDQNNYVYAISRIKERDEDRIDLIRFRALK